MERLWEKSIGKLIVRVVEGDLVAREVDAIATSTNSFMRMEAGAAASIKAAGGEEIELEAVELGPIAVGAAVVTGAGRLPARYVIHAAIMGADKRTNEDKVRMAVLNVLRRCSEQGVETLAVPVFGTGEGGLPVSVAAETVLREISKYCGSRETSFKLIEVVVESQEDYRTCSAELQKVFS